MNPHLQNLNLRLTEWQSLQPLKREDDERLWRKLRLDWNYHSNHIEGNTLTYGETEILLIHGQATGDHVLRDYEEMKAHDVAIEHMRALVAGERPLTEGDICDFNRILIKESFWKDAITPDRDYAWRIQETTEQRPHRLRRDLPLRRSRRGPDPDERTGSVAARGA